MTFSQGIIAEEWESNNKDCFCCSPYYNMPKPPPITGPQTVACGTAAVYKTIKCQGATILWTVSPNITGTTGNTTPTFTIPANAPAGVYVITLEFKCGTKTVKNSVRFTITGIENCTSSFNYTTTTNSNGYITISTVPVMQVSGQEHWWGIQYNGTFPNCKTCASIPFDQFNSSGVWGGYISATGSLTPYMGSGITTGSTPYGISYSGFTKNQCVRITHYVKCCGVLKRSTWCFDISDGVNRVAKTQDSGYKIVDEIVPNN